MIFHEPNVLSLDITLQFIRTSSCSKCLDRMNGLQMCLRFSKSCLPCALERASETAKRLFSGSLMTINHHIVSDPDDEFAFLNNRSFSLNSSPSSAVELGLVAQVQQRNRSVDTPYFLNQIVSFCAKSSLYDVGIQIHSLLVKMGFTSNAYICTALVDMYGKCTEVLSSQKLFDEMTERKVVTWNSLISGYLQVRSPEIAIQLFIKMLKEGIELTVFSLSTVLVGCSQLEDEGIGAQVHGLCLKQGLCFNVVVETGLIDMYSKCYNVEDSRRVFDQMQEKNVITWSCMVTGYSQNEQPNDAMILFREMLRRGMRPNYVAYNSLLRSFSNVGFLDFCKQVHCRVIRVGFLSNLYILVTLVTVYSKCGCSLEDFQKIYSSIGIWNQILWNGVIAGFCNLGCCEQALKCFSEMRQAGINIDYFALTTIIGVIGLISGHKEGKQMHAIILKTGYASNVFIQNRLVFMYARCGAISDSMKVFSLMDEHDLVSWNSLLSGCAHHGYGKEAVELFEQMQKTEIKPDGTTFLAVLSACSHAGFIDNGLECFYLMKNDTFLEPPRIEHYAAVVDLLGRAGHLNEAESFISSMPIDPGPSIYKALLSACQVHGNREIAIRSAKRLMELWPNDPATYVLLSNVLKAAGYWDDAHSIRELMCDIGMTKKPAYSWV